MKSELRKAAQDVVDIYGSKIFIATLHPHIEALRAALATPAAAPSDAKDDSVVWHSVGELEQAIEDAIKYQYVLSMCAHISGCTVEQVDAKIVKVMAEMPMRES